MTGTPSGRRGAGPRAGRRFGLSAEERAVAEGFMREALAEAAKGLGRTSPNPAVGAVIVKDGRVVGRGHHAKAGEPHAEVMALRDADVSVVGADLYTTLEPCGHFGRTPPCALAVLKAGIRRVFVGSRDPNPLVNGKGIAKLRRGGVQVVTEVLRRECDALDAHWFHYIRTGRPYVTLKVALTLDGRIAARTGDARWITGEAARAEVHRLRDRVDAVLVGSGTARADDPLLTTRLPPDSRGRAGRDPIRVVLDSRLTLPPRLRLFHMDSSAPTWVATVVERGRRFGPGVEVIRCRATRGVKPGRVELNDLLLKLGQRGITHVLVEGGGALHAAFLAQGLVDRVVAFIAPKILGGGKAWLEGAGPARVAEALRLEQIELQRLGEDLMVCGVLVDSPARRRA